MPTDLLNAPSTLFSISHDEPGADAKNTGCKAGIYTLELVRVTGNCALRHTHSQTHLGTI